MANQWGTHHARAVQVLMGRIIEPLGSFTYQCQEPNRGTQVHDRKRGNQEVIIVEDDELYAWIKDRMLEHGVRIVSKGNGF